MDLDAGSTKPIGDPNKLVVAECDNVQFFAKKSGRIRSAMVSFDKDVATGSPGRKPAYLSRHGYIVVPIDDRPRRDPSQPTETFHYSIHVDCPENESDSPCRPLDPMIVVER